MKHAMLFMVILVFSKLISCHSDAEADFDVRQHLSTVTGYEVAKDIVNKSFVPADIPEECVPIHLNLLARHGTRLPTEKRMKELDGLEHNLSTLINQSKTDRIPSWLRGWKSPWKEQIIGAGELISKGEKELFDLGNRTRERFPNLFDKEYYPKIYTINSTSVPRTSASAVAFGMGLFSGNGSLGPGKHRAFAISSGSNDTDEILRFFDGCSRYKDYKEIHKPVIHKLKEPYLDNITSALFGRYGLNFTSQDVSSLWFLCKEEASLLDITNQACGLFTPFEITLLEWMDDMELYILKGYGNPLNYKMGVSLLKDIVNSMERAIQAKQEKRGPGRYEKARLRFAHAETLVPLSCSLGLFREGSGYDEEIEKQPWKLPQDPGIRKWKGSTVTPFAGNNMLILYSCPTTDKSSDSYSVQVLQNEHPIPIPACNCSDFCPFEVFKEKVVTPHKKDTFNTICNVKVERTVNEISQKCSLKGESDSTHKDEL